MKATNKEPCRVFIDHDLRVYMSWTDYINDNKIHEFAMVLPKNGRYQGDENGKVLLERHLSPACGISTKVLLGLDITSSVIGLGSGCVMLAAAVPAITVLPVVMIGAAVAGATVGIYSIVRSSMHIHDKRIHGEVGHVQK